MAQLKQQEPKMNSKTHKVISATYTNEWLYAVPIDWAVEDIIIKYGELFYKQEKKHVPHKEYEPDYKYPDQIEDADVDIENYFDCEEEDSSSEEEEECDDCEGKCRADETETCDNCSVELRVGCGNKPSHHSIFNGLCDDCREDEEEEEESEEEKEKGCVKCGVRPRHNQTDEDGSYLCLKCEEEEEEEEDEEEDEQCISHPPYYCDGGCGKIMGQGKEDDCKRVCDDCVENIEINPSPKTD